MSGLELPEDFRELLVALADARDARTELVLIGGWAMAIRPDSGGGRSMLVRSYSLWKARRGTRFKLGRPMNKPSNLDGVLATLKKHLRDEHDFTKIADFFHDKVVPLLSFAGVGSLRRTSS